MLVSDKWNPRLWLRDWLNQPSLAELEEREVAQAVGRQMVAALATERTTMAATDAAMANGIEGLQKSTFLADRFRVSRLSESPGTPSNELPPQRQSPAPSSACPL